jgi:phenylacetic acid degradation operon negative regulatory protein
LESSGSPAPDHRRLGASSGSTWSMLLTVLGEFVRPMAEPVWTASLLYVLTGFGIREPTARQAIARAADAGWIEGTKRGREARWRLTSAGVVLIDDITRRVMSLHDAPEYWDRKCLILAVSIPVEKRDVRKRLYSQLGWAGWGNPAPGLWANPHLDRLEETRKIIRDLGLRDTTIAFVGSPVEVGLTDHEIVARAWNLDAVAARYAEVLDAFENADPAPGDDLLFTFLALVDEWRQFPYMDPQLPRDLLPDWIGRRAADTFLALRRKWAPAAREHWADVVRRTTPP